MVLVTDDCGQGQKGSVMKNLENEGFCCAPFEPELPSSSVGVEQPKQCNQWARGAQPALTPLVGERTQRFVYRPFLRMARNAVLESGGRVSRLGGDRDRYSL